VKGGGGGEDLYFGVSAGGRSGVEGGRYAKLLPCTPACSSP
jgi:hypothetical protein